MNRLLTLLAAVVSIGASAQTMQTEYFVDTDPGLGKGIQLVVPTDDEGNGTLQFTIPKNQLPTGRHLIGVRTFIVKDDITEYSPTVYDRIDIFQPSDRKPLMYLEYFWDEDPGYGEGTHIALPEDFEATLDKLPISTDGLTPGKHLLGVRIRGGEGWGPTITEKFDIWPVGQFGSLRLMEYFWDEDPGFGNGTQIALPATDEANLEKMHISTTELTPGLHRLGVRFAGGLGWSPTIVEDIVVLSAEDFGKILKMEYFWDVDPGYGNGTPLAFEPESEVTLDNVVIPLPNDGQDHKLGLRGFGNNKWGPTFMYDTSTPPRYVNANDLAALRSLYEATDGANWSGTKWSPYLSTENMEIRADNWSGVSFNSEDRVSAIDLHARRLTGDLQEALPALPEMTSMNLSQNALKGDPAIFVSNNPQLTELNLSYNQFDELSARLSLNLSDKLLNLSYQHRVYNDTYNWPGLDQLYVSDIFIKKNHQMDIQLPAIANYKHGSQALNTHPKLMVYNPANYKEYGSLTWQENLASYTFKSSVTNLDVNNGSNVIMQPAKGNTLVGSAYPAVIHFVAGDANMSGQTEITDVTRTLNYVLGKANQGVISLWAANTFTEGETSRVINIQDIVCTVNIVLENQDASVSEVRRFNSRARGADRNLFYTDGQELKLDATDDIAAFDLELQGVGPDQVRLLLNARNWQMHTRRTANGVRLVVFSPTGESLQAGTAIRLLRLGAEASPIAVQTSSPDANELTAAVSGNAPTGIDKIRTAELQVSARDGRINLVSSARCGRTLISLYNTQGILLSQHQLTELPAGLTVIGEGLPQTGGLVVMTVSNDEIGTKIYKLQIAK